MDITDGKQQTLPGLEMKMADRGRRSVGFMGEMLAFRLFEQAGYLVGTGLKKRGDLRVIDPESGECFNVEVKTARRGKDRKWRFLLWKKGEQNHRHSDYVLLLAVLESGQVEKFLVPTGFLYNQRQAVICSHPMRYKGKLAPFRQMTRKIQVPSTEDSQWLSQPCPTGGVHHENI